MGAGYWELAEKPRRKGRVFIATVEQTGGSYTTTLAYRDPPRGSPGYVDKVVGSTSIQSATTAGKEMIKALKKSQYDQVIEVDLHRERLCHT